jgi:hypothetical protein
MKLYDYLMKIKYKNIYIYIYIYIPPNMQLYALPISFMAGK